VISVWSDALVVVVGLITVGISAVTGFGIGSLLTPVLALQVDTRLAVAAVALWWWITMATIGVTVGTVLGSRMLTRIPEVWFRRVLTLVLAGLGSVMLVRGSRG
jgi:uncharacterized membrane protein YfcA